MRMPTNLGKVFEAEIKASIPSGFYVERYKDDTSGFHGVSNPADFRLYRYPFTFLLELKTHKGKSIPLANSHLISHGQPQYRTHMMGQLSVKINPISLHRFRPYKKSPHTAYPS